MRTHLQGSKIQDWDTSWSEYISIRKKNKLNIKSEKQSLLGSIIIGQKKREIKFIITIYIEPDDATILSTKQICDYMLSFELLYGEMISSSLYKKCNLISG